MKRGSLAITAQTIRIIPVNGTVWMSESQIAALFSVFVSKIGSNIRSIFKNNLLRAQEVMHTHYYAGGSVDLYNLEMITALAYRIDSPAAELFRKWTTQRQTTREKAVHPIRIHYLKGMLPC